MQFHIAVNLERMSASEDMGAVARHTLDMVQMAEAAGFETAWAAEHHALEMTIAPNPFQILTWWAGETEHIRLGSAVVNAAYWHPIKLAGEAAMLDLISGGRLEFGIGSGAYQREFDRMTPGVSQKDGHLYMRESLPLIRELWQGDVAHEGTFWQFPAATSCPKPAQNEVPIWVAARSPATFDYAVEVGASMMSWPLTLPFAEAEKYAALRAESTAKGAGYRGRFAMMRHAAVWEDGAGRDAALGAVRGVLGQFGNLMMKKGEVRNGFPDPVPLAELDGNARVDPTMLEENLLFGTPDVVIEKLHKYRELGVDSFIYYASMGLGPAHQKRSLELFCSEVMPEFAA
ncbi:MAG: LLM class flavin-dependent oxidoreductase [Pseudomonadota bacterium]